MTPYLPFPTGQCTKINEARNNYRYIKRVEREWFGHDLNLDGTELDEKRNGETKVLEENTLLDGMLVPKEAGGACAIEFQGTVDSFRKVALSLAVAVVDVAASDVPIKCDVIDIDLPLKTQKASSKLFYISRYKMFCFCDNLMLHYSILFI